MKRANSETESLVYAYGVVLAPAPAGIRPCPLESAPVQREVVLQRDLWDRLVDLWREHEAAELAAARADDPAIATLEAERTALDADIDALIAERRVVRKKARARVATPEIDAQLAPLFERRLALWREIGAAMKRWRRDHAEKRRALLADYAAARKRARQESGLYWANYNRVMDDFDATLSRCLKQGRRPRYADRSREDGCLTVQIQRTKSGLGAAPDELIGGGLAALAVRPDGRTGRGGRLFAMLEMRINAAGDAVRLPMILHRPPPAGCRIKSAQLVWRREGGRRIAKLCLTLSRPAVARARNDGAVIGVDIGWRLTPDGALRVAVVDDGEQARVLSLPADWLAGMSKVEAITSAGDKADAVMRAVLDGRSDIPPMVAAALAAPRFSAADLLGWIGRQKDRAGLPEPLIAWYHRRRHLDAYADGLRARLIRRRREIYRLFARDLAARAAVIAIEDIDLAGLARSRSLEQAQRRQRQLAAPHTLLAEIAWQAKKAGARLERIGGASTLVCNRCGERQNPEDRSQIIWTCNHCGFRADQDVNAARNLRDVAAGGQRSQRLEKAMEIKYVA